MTQERGERFEVDFSVSLSWQTGDEVRRVTTRCLDLSASGARLESKSRVEAGTTVMVHSGHFGRMGLASVKYCTRNTMDYDIGICFGAMFRLREPARRKILEGLLRKAAPQKSAAAAAGSS